MSGVVFDTGALIALDRGDRAVLVLVAEARRLGRQITVPAGCVAQAWRSPARQVTLGAFLRLPNVHVVALDPEEARLVGVLLAGSRTRDIVDAHVALCAKRRDEPVLTSDVSDIRRIAPTLVIHRV